MLVGAVVIAASGAVVGAAETTPAVVEVQPPLATPPAAASGPHIAFAELTHDFGKISSGATARNDFVFTNTGNATLVITEVRPGCGCTTAGQWDKQVEPGATGRIPLEFRSAGFSGPISKSATITCNDPSQPSVILKLVGNVWVPVQITPTTAMFQYDSGETAGETKTLRIVSNLDEPLVLSEPECTNRNFKVAIKTIKPGKEFDLEVTTVPPLATGMITAPITVKTSATNMPVIKASAYALERQPILISPTQIFLSGGPLPTTNRVQVTIRASGTNALVVSEPTINLPDVKLELQETQPGRVYALTAVFPPGFQVPANVRPEISLKSNHPRLATLHIPVNQYRPPNRSLIRSNATSTVRPVAIPNPPGGAGPIVPPTNRVTAPRVAPLTPPPLPPTAPK